MTLLTTPRLTLRRCQPSDLSDFISLERDPEVMLYLNGGHPVDRDAIIDDPGFLMPEGTEPYVWTAREIANNAFVGWFCLWSESTTLAELGYRLHRQFWGQGLAVEGASALIHWGFSQTGYDQIIATTMAVNHGSRRVMEKLGMTYSRTEYPDTVPQIPGAELGEVWYELRRPPAWPEIIQVFRPHPPITSAAARMPDCSAPSR